MKRTHLQLRRLRRSALLGHGLTLLALVAQVSLPWVKGWHDARELSPRAARFALAEGTAPHASLSAPPAEQSHDAQHKSGTCGVCHLLSQSRAALLADVPFVTAAPLVDHPTGESHQAVPQAARVTAAAPRAPPALLS